MILSTLFLIIGITGVIAIAINFILEASNKLDKEHHIFAFLYTYGSAALLAYSAYNSVWLFVVLNGFLVLVGLYGIYKVYKRNN